MTEAAYERDETRAVGTGLIAATIAAAAVILVGSVYGWLHQPPSRIDDVSRCLTNEKRLAVLQPFGDPVAQRAGAGSVATQIEGNRVTISLGRTAAETAGMVAQYRGLGVPAGRLTLRGRLVALWQSPPTQSELQTVYDCTY